MDILEVSKNLKLVALQALIPGYRATTEAYLAAMIGLGMRLVRLIALALRLPLNYFDDKFEKPMAFLRPLHYNEEPSDPKNGLFAAGKRLALWLMLFSRY